MIQDRLGLEVEKVGERYQRLRFWRALTIGWFFAAIIGLSLAAMGVESARNGSTVLPLLGGVAAVLVLVCAWLVTASAPSHDWVARQIENEFPDLRSCLLAAVEQQPALPDGRFGFLQESVIRQALVHAACHAWPQVVPTRRLAWAIATQCVTLGLFVLATNNNRVNALREKIRMANVNRVSGRTVNNPMDSDPVSNNRKRASLSRGNRNLVNVASEALRGCRTTTKRAGLCSLKEVRTASPR